MSRETPLDLMQATRRLPPFSRARETRGNADRPTPQYFLYHVLGSATINGRREGKVAEGNGF